MKITVLEPSGYCVGVERAISLAIETKQKYKNRNVVVLGMLVHNDESLKTLQDNGITTIYKQCSSLEELINEIKEPSIVILTAHGHSKNLELELLKRNHEIVDATCPFVQKSMEDIKKQIINENIVFYIGVKNHPEATASLSISNNVYFIDSKNPEIPKINCINPFVISQTTLSELEVESINKKIINKYPNAIISKGVCNASTSRQKALLNLDNDVDLILVVGDKKSNNTKTLFNLAKSTYPKINVLQIENEKDINKKDLLGLSHIVISSGASTPKATIDRIKNKLMN